MRGCAGPMRWPDSQPVLGGLHGGLVVDFRALRQAKMLRTPLSGVGWGARSSDRGSPVACAGSGSLGPGPVLAAPSSTQATGSNPGTSMFHPCGLGRRPRTATAFTRKVGRVLRDGRQEAACARAPSLAGRGASSCLPGSIPGPCTVPSACPTEQTGRPGLAWRPAQPKATESLCQEPPAFLYPVPWGCREQPGGHWARGGIGEPRGT